MYAPANLPLPRTSQRPQPALVGQAHSGSGGDAPPTRLTELAGAADEIASDQRRPTPAPLPEQSTAKWGRRRKLIAALTSGVLLGAAAAAALLIVGGDEKPGLPAGVKVTAGRGTITVSWQPGAGKAHHYVVYRDGQVVAPSVTSTTFVDKLHDTGTHTYTVQAVNEAGAASNQTSESVVAAQVRDLNGPERDLVGRLPITLVDRSSCMPILSLLDSHLDVAVTCEPAPGQSPRPPALVPQVVEAYGAASATALNAAVTDEINVHGAKSGSCSSTPQQGTWNFTQSPKAINGKIVCYTAAPRAYLLWSYTSARLYVRISTTNSYSSLQNYWQGAALHLS
jgi:hypothetical protein